METDELIMKSTPAIYEVVNAPDEIDVTLELLLRGRLSLHGMALDGSLLFVGAPDFVTYKMISFDVPTLTFKYRKF
jgi:hypothetical protein